MSDAHHAAPKGPPWGTLGFAFVALAIGGTLLYMFLTETARGAAGFAEIIANAAPAFTTVKLMFHDFAIWIGTILIGLLAIGYIAKQMKGGAEPPHH
jgi:hypothetical protein